MFAKVGLELKPWLPAEASHTRTPTRARATTTRCSRCGASTASTRTSSRRRSRGPGGGPDELRRRRQGRHKLRDDAAKSIVYAIFLIMLYLAFRFDIRYAPGAAFATIHDAVMVIGVFAITWTEVSLTSVAGLLTVMGYSDQRHRDRLRPHPREPGEAQGQEDRTHHRHLDQRDARAHDPHVIDRVRDDADHEHLRHRPGEELRVRDEHRRDRRDVLVDLPRRADLHVGVEEVVLGPPKKRAIPAHALAQPMASADNE